MQNLQVAFETQPKFSGLSQVNQKYSDLHAAAANTDAPARDYALGGIPDIAGLQVQTTYSPDGDFITWPQGNLAEVRNSGFGLEVPNLMARYTTWTMDPLRARPGLTEMMHYARTKGLGFKLIVPTARYSDDLQLAELHFAFLLYDLMDGTYGALPTNFRLCLGCEYADQMEFSGRPEVYGRLVNAMLDVARTIENSEGEKFRISVQMGCNEGEHDEIRQQISLANLATYFSSNGQIHPPH